CEKVCTLRAVRNFAKSFWLCAQAADKASRRAVVGELAAGSRGLLASEWSALRPFLELESCASMPLATNAASHRRQNMHEIINGRRFTIKSFTLILRGA